MNRNNVKELMTAAALGAGLFAGAGAVSAQCGVVKITDDNPNILSFMGSTCHMGTNRMVFGAPGFGASGRVLMFERNDSNSWVEDGEFVSPAAPQEDGFGQAVAYFSNYAAVGAPLADVGGDDNTGRVYIYYRSADGWSLLQTIENPSPGDDDYFGHALAFTRKGDAIVLAVGVPGDDLTGAANAGRVRIYSYHPELWPNGWVLESSVVSIDIDADEFFGGSVAVNEDYLVVGSPGEDYGGFTDAGAATFYTAQPGFQFTNGLRLLPSLSKRNTLGLFGRRVAISGNRVAVGAPGDDEPGAADCGAIYTYHHTGVTWTMDERVLESTPSTADHIGDNIDLEGDLLAAGDPSDEHAYTWRWNGSEWDPELQLSATDPPASGAHDFGASVSISPGGDYLLVGDSGDDLPGFGGAGSAYTFIVDQRPSADCAGWIADPTPEVTRGVYLGCTGGDNDGFTLCALTSGDKWYKFTAPCTGILTLSTCGTNDLFGVDSGIDTVISVQTGCPGDKIFLLACNDDFTDGNDPNACFLAGDAGSLRDSALRLHVEVGVEYRIRVASYGGAGPFGQFVLNVDYTCCQVDWDANGVVNSTDVSTFINDWFEDQANGTLQTDFNHDGVSNSTDVSDFINLWFAGCEL